MCTIYRRKRRRKRKKNTHNYYRRRVCHFYQEYVLCAAILDMQTCSLRCLATLLAIFLFCFSRSHSSVSFRCHHFSYPEYDMNFDSFLWKYKYLFIWIWVPSSVFFVLQETKMGYEWVRVRGRELVQNDVQSQSHGSHYQRVDTYWRGWREETRILHMVIQQKQQAASRNSGVRINHTQTKPIRHYYIRIMCIYMCPIEEWMRTKMLL